MQIAGLHSRPTEWLFVGMGCVNLILKAQESWESITQSMLVFSVWWRTKTSSPFLYPRVLGDQMRNSPFQLSLVWILPSHQAQR